MSEQTIQNGLFSIPVTFEKFTCRSLGATTIKDLVSRKEISGLTLKECEKIRARKPDAIIQNANREIVIFIEMKDPSKFTSSQLVEKAIWQELDVARRVKAKIYVVSDGDTFIWINPLTGELIADEKGNPITRQINPKCLTKEQCRNLAELIDDICFCIDGSNNQLLPKEFLDPTPLAQKTARILKNMSLSSAKNSLYTFVEFFTFKFLSDIGVLKGIYSFESIYQIHACQSRKTLSSSISPPCGKSFWSCFL